MARGARNKFDAPVFEPEVFRKQMYCFEKKCWWLVGTFWPPAVIPRPGNCSPCTPRYVTGVMQIGKFSESKQVFRSEHHEHLQFSKTVNDGSCTDCQQRLLAAFQVSSFSFVSLLCLPNALFRRGPVFVFFNKTSRIFNKFTFSRLNKSENNFWIVLEAASAP